MGNPFVHVELTTTDLARAKGFYSRPFDWDLEDTPLDYTLIRVGQGTGEGMMKAPSPDIPSHWLPYVLVDDVVASTERAKALGVRVVRGPTEVPGQGWFSILVDPTGASLGLWQAGPRKPLTPF